MNPKIFRRGQSRLGQTLLQTIFLFFWSQGSSAVDLRPSPPVRDFDKKELAKPTLIDSTPSKTPRRASREVPVHLLRKLTVFPLKMPTELRALGEEAWWKSREVLTERRRFLVASREFMKQRDVLQPRGGLQPADAIILGRLLDADALVTLELKKDRNLTLNSYEGEYGRLLWTKSIQMSTQVPSEQQLASLVVRLMKEFVADIPYQGFVIRDPVRDEVLFKMNHQQHVKVNLGINSEVGPGDPVQFLSVRSDRFDPILQGAGIFRVIGEGTVDRVERDEALIRLTRVHPKFPIKFETPARFPKEWKRLKDQFISKDQLQGQLAVGYIDPEGSLKKQEFKEKKPLYSALTFLGNLAAFLLLAL